MNYFAVYNLSLYLQVLTCHNCVNKALVIKRNKFNMLMSVNKG